jgi:Beta-propeller repeat
MRYRGFPGSGFYGLLGAAVGVFGAVWCAAQAPPRARAGQVEHAQAAAAKVEVSKPVPLGFEPNQGQVRGPGSGRVKFLARGRGYTLFLTSTGATLRLRSRRLDGRSATVGARSQMTKGRGNPNRDSSAYAVLRQELAGASPQTKVVGLDELPGKASYFIGNDPEKWHRNVATYGRVKLAGVYPGIDAIYYGRDGQLEYDFVVAPGANPKAIRLQIGVDGGHHASQGPKRKSLAAASAPFSSRPGTRSKSSDKLHPAGAESAHIGSNGDLVIATEAGEIRLKKLLAYQESLRTHVAERKRLDAHYLLRPVRQAGGKTRYEVSFAIGAYDRTQPLIIDPVLSYSTYLGGSGLDYAYGIAVDAVGNAYITGLTDSLDFPVSHATQDSIGGGTCGTGLDVFPCFDVFVTKLAASGSSAVYSTYLGGSGDDRGTGIAVDSSGNAYVTGYTNSADFPVANAFQPAYSGGNCGSVANPDPCFEAFVAELNASGAALAYSTYLGATGQDLAAGIAVNGAHEATVIGSTSSVDFPTTPGVVQTSYAGGALDAFVTRLDSTGSRPLFSTYLGGSDEDRGLGIAVDEAGDSFVTGSTASKDFPSVRALQPANAGGTCGPVASQTPCADAFVTKLNPTGTAFVYSTYLGGSGGDSGNAIAVDAGGAAYVAGMTASSGFPVTPGSFQQTGGGVSVDAFVTKISPDGSAPAFSTYLGGLGAETAYGIAVDSTGNSYVTGYVQDDAFPVANPIQGSPGGFYDAFVTELNAAGSALLFSTYLGGSGNDTGRGIAVDGAGNATIAGGTFSEDLPTVSAFQPSYGGGSFDAFVAKIGGFGRGALTISGGSFTFADQGVATLSPPQTVTLTNRGGGEAVLSFTLKGDFSQMNNCGKSLAPNASCEIQLQFAPTVMGHRTGDLTVTGEGFDGPPAVQLSGTGVASFTLASVPSGTTVVMGTNTASFAVTASSQFSYSGEVSLGCDGGAPVDCAFNPAVIVPGGASTLTVANLAQSAVSALAFDINGASQNQTATLPITIKISDFTLSSTSPGASVSAGQSATFQLVLAGINGFNQPVTMGCSGAPPQSTCSISPVSLTPSGPGDVSLSVTVTTTARSLGEPRIYGPDTRELVPGYGWQWLILVAFLCIGTARRRKGKLPQVRLAAATIGFFLLLCTSCGGGGGGGGQAVVERNAGTPAGRYDLKVSGTSGQLTRSVTLSLQVN